MVRGECMQDLFRQKDELLDHTFAFTSWASAFVDFAPVIETNEGQALASVAGEFFEGGFGGGFGGGHCFVSFYV